MFPKERSNRRGFKSYRATAESENNLDMADHEDLEQSTDSEVPDAHFASEGGR